MNEMPSRMTAPVAFFIFNRPDTTARVFEAIRAARPSTLFVVADGPRRDRADDLERCAAARRVVEDVDWPCQVAREYAPANMGLKRRIGGGLSWVFNHTETAIILEDDCLPDATFFRYCDELLTRYRTDERVMSISGNQFVPRPVRTAASYSFSRQPLIWGWATWRRAWRQYEPDMAAWPALRDAEWMHEQLREPRARDYWSYLFDRNHRLGDAGSWDYAWQLACWRAQGLAVHPSVNLVTNIGFGADGTHSIDPRQVGANIPASPMAFPLVHPADVVRDEAGDAALETAMFSGHLDRLLRHLGRRVRTP